MRRLVLVATALAALFPTVIYAHERFIKHDLKYPLHEQYFARQAGVFLGMQPDMLRIGTTSCLLLTVFLILFFFRQSLDGVIEHRLLFALRGASQRFLHHVANFLMDQPVRL